jgi:sarcosine oxidase, subunit delta
MLRIHCPCCGPRDEDEFVFGGEAHLARPDPGQASDEEWAQYLFFRANPKGVHHERWQHVYGCRCWFNVARDTVSHRILAVYGLDAPKPSLPAGEAR